MKKKSYLAALMISLVVFFTGYSNIYAIYQPYSVKNNQYTPYTVINSDIPFFVAEFSICNLNMPTESFQEYSFLDALGRCGVAFCNLGIDTIPNEPREDISSIHPSGWQERNILSDIIDGDYLYNRCHLIAHMLSGENANEKNLITGTTYMNIQGMEPFELEIYKYIKKTHNHVLYRVTPVFEGNNLLAAGVLMEAYSIEDNGKGVCFNVFCYNEQPGMIIDHANGDAELDPYISYVVDITTNEFHYLSCNDAKAIRNSDRQYLRIPITEIIKLGCIPCTNCNP